MKTSENETVVYTLLFSLSNLLFGIAGRPFGMLTGTFTILPFQPTLGSGVGLTFFGFRRRDYIPTL